MGDASKLCRTTLIDTVHQLILSRRETSFLNIINNRLHIGSQFGKERELYDSDGALKKTDDVYSSSSFLTGKAHVNNRDLL